LPIAQKLLHSLRGHRDRDEHNVLGIQGPPGIGKSTLGLAIALNLEPSFGISNVHYNRDDWPDILRSPKRGVFLLDEGANVAMNRTWQQGAQVRLMQILNMIRQRNHTLIWCTPNLQRLDIVVREDLLTHKINCYRKGLARVQTPKFNYQGEPEGWKTWPGILAWGPLEAHPLWKPYSDAKAQNYSEATQQVNSMDILRDPYDGKGALVETPLHSRGRTRSQTRRDQVQGKVSKQKRRVALGSK
jgi:hypothetical protein